MSERLTKERLDEIKDDWTLQKHHAGEAVPELIAHVSFLEKALEQAVSLGQIELFEDPTEEHFVLAGLATHSRLDARPELYEYLRSLTPPQVQK